MVNTEFVGKDDSFKMAYLDAWQFELGECYVGEKNVVYLVSPKYIRFAINAQKRLESIKYEDEQMEVTFSATVPHIIKQFKTLNGKMCIVFKKPVDSYPLKNVLEACGDEINGKHIAWIISRLLNISQFLTYNKLVHNGMSIDNIFINPAQHIVTIYGGWWYTVNIGQKMIGTNKTIFEHMIAERQVMDKASPITDLTSIKFVLRQLCSLEKTETTNLPQPMIEYMNDKTSDDPLKEMEKWDIAKRASYGPPKFIEMPINKNKIYIKGGF